MDTVPKTEYKGKPKSFFFNNPSRSSEGILYPDQVLNGKILFYSLKGGTAVG